MKIFLNTIAFITFIVQCLSFAFNALNLKAPENTREALHNAFYFTAFLCSLMTVGIFMVLYNFNFKYLEKKIPNCILFVITTFGLYIHLLQLFELNDFLIVSCILLIIDCYIMNKILHNLFLEDNNLSSWKL